MGIPETHVPKTPRLEEVPLVDIHRVLKRHWSDFSIDGVHPDRRGYRQIADAWFKTLFPQ